MLDRLHRGDKRAAGRIVTMFGIVSAVINIPVLLLTPTGWWYFFSSTLRANTR